LVIKNLKADGK